jgi:hypothetical protein
LHPLGHLTIKFIMAKFLHHCLHKNIPRNQPVSALVGLKPECSVAVEMQCRCADLVVLWYVVHLKICLAEIDPEQRGLT